LFPADKIIFSKDGVEVNFEIEIRDEVENEFIVDYKYTKTFIKK